MRKGELWLVDLPTTGGHEQEGTRPVVLLVEAEANIVIVAPCTSNIQALRFPHTIEIKPSKVNGLDTISIALIFQLRALDKIRLKRRIGVLEPTLLNDLEKMIKKLLGFSS